MVKLNKMFGVALVLCLAMVSFGVIADDSDSSDAIAGPSLEQFSNNMNGYAKYLLGSSQTVISSSVSEDTLTATVNTASSNIDSISMNLYDCFDKFMDAVKSTDYLESVTIKNTATSAEYKIIVKDGSNTVLNRGAMLDFALSVLQVIKDNKTSSTVTYNGSIIFNGYTESAKTLKITINLDSTVRGLLETFFELKLIEIEVSQGKITSITINNNAYLADVLVKPSVSKFQGMTLIEIISCFAADGALAKLVSNSSQQSYLNKVCGKIVEANNLAGFIKNVFFVEVNSITMTFGEPTVSSSKNFKGLMETIKDAMSKGTNFDKKVSDISSYNDSTGIIAMKPITVKWNHGTETGTIVEDQKVDVVFGKATINTTVRSGQSTGTIAIEPSANKYTCWDEVTIKCTAASNYTLSAVSYKVGDGEEIALTKAASQKFVIPSAGENTVINIFASFTGSGPGPGPGPTPVTKYTVTFIATEGGSVSPESLSVSSGTSYSASGSKLVFGSSVFATDVVATAKDGYIFKSWSSTSGKVTSNMTITATFEKSGSVDPIEKVVDNGSIYLPGNVVQALGIKDPSKLVLSIKTTKDVPTNVPEDALCYDVTLTYEGKEITSFTDEVTIGLKYTVPAGTDVKNVKVYWVSDDGLKVENMNATYNSSKGLMEFEIPHLSVFAITQKTIEPIHGDLVSISVKTTPKKLTYTEGEKFDPTGLVITLTYDYGDPTTLEYKGNESKFSFTPSLTTPLKTTDKSVTITYEGKTTTQAITVSATPEPTPSGGDNTVLIIVIVVIVLIVIAAAVFFYMKKRTV
ncbi:MAG: bacterial Ig-like domain-containing protein [Candidatus Methanomethylophilaceae archaeon]|nr:bacterial Ig-like domain-containing protein [Candidatus Methanomethylophilaceae archaeon]